MQTINKFNQLGSVPDMGQIIKTSGLSMASNLNCMRIGIVQEFYPDDLTVQVRLVNKRNIGLNPDGTQNVREIAPIYAKVCYCNPFITYPIKKGDECVVLFSDREIESWFITGEANPEGYTRMHDLTDAVALIGVRSIPQMIQIITDALHLFYGSSDIQLKDAQIDITTPTLNITGNTTQTGNITATNLSATAAASGTFTASGKTITVTNGIITAIA